MGDPCGICGKSYRPSGDNFFKRLGRKIDRIDIDFNFRNKMSHHKHAKITGVGVEIERTAGTPEVRSEIKQVDNQTYDNMVNNKGSGISNKSTNGKATKFNSAVDTLMGWFSDGKMGKDSKVVINNNTSDIRKEFISELNTDGEEGVSKAEFLQRAEDIEASRNQAKTDGVDYYGRDGVDYSKEKLEATFTAMDTSGDGIIDQNESNAFFNKTSTTGKFQRKEDGETKNYTNTTQIRLGDLKNTEYSAILDNTTTQTGGEVIQEATEGTVTETEIAAGKGDLNIGSYTSKDRIFKKGDAPLEHRKTTKFQVGDGYQMTQAMNMLYKENPEAKNGIPLDDLASRMNELWGIDKEETITRLQNLGIDTNVDNLKIKLDNAKASEMSMRHFEKHAENAGHNLYE